MWIVFTGLPGTSGQLVKLMERASLIYFQKPRAVVYWEKLFFPETEGTWLLSFMSFNFPHQFPRIFLRWHPCWAHKKNGLYLIFLIYLGITDFGAQDIF